MLETETDENIQKELWKRGAEIKMDIIRHRVLRPWRRGCQCMGVLCALGAKLVAMDIDARDMPVADFASIVASQYNRSIVVKVPQSTDTVHGASITGTFRSLTFEQAVETIEATTGYRAVDMGGITYITSSYDQLVDVELSGASNVSVNGVAIAGGYATFSGEKVVANNFRDYVRKTRDRRTAKMEILVTDTGQETSDALQELLNSATVTLSYQGELFAPRNASTIDMRSVLGFLNQDKNTEIIMNTTVKIMSGEQIETAVGRVLEREIYVRPDQTSTDLVTRYDTLQLGFELKTTAFWDGTAWQVRYQITDTDFTTEQKRASFTGVDVIMEGQGAHVLKLNRNVDNVTERGIPILSRIPWVKKAFTWTTKTGQKRAINIIINIHENQKTN